MDASAKHDSEVPPRARRRTFPAAYKLSILEKADGCARGSGELGALLRREGLFSSTISNWRKQREQGALEALAAQRRGRKSDRNPLQTELDQLKQENARLKGKLEQAQIIIEFQKKACMLLEIPLATQNSGEKSA